MVTIQMLELHCIGDGNTSCFIGREPDVFDEYVSDVEIYKTRNSEVYKNIKIYAYKLGENCAVLAYGVNKYANLINKIFTSFTNEPKFTKILFMFGETDCSTKIKSCSEEDGIGVDVCVNHYFDFIANNFGQFVNGICFWGPSVKHVLREGDFSVDVSSITKMFNDNLRKRCENIKPKYQFCTTFGEITSGNTEIRDKLLFQLYFPHSFTFGIVTAGDNDVVINTIVDSIVLQKIPFYEIIIVGKTNIMREKDNVITIDFDENIKHMWITKKKNLVVQNAKYETVVLLHDYIYFLEGWFEGFLEYGNDYRVCVNKIQNSDGSRYRDHVFFPRQYRFLISYNYIPPQLLTHALVPYGYKLDDRLAKYLYISGSYYVVKRELGLQIPLNEARGWGDGDDLEFTDKLIMNGIPIKFNSHSTVKFLKYKGAQAWEKELSCEELDRIRDSL